MRQKWLKLKKGKVCSMKYHNITKDDMLNGDGIRVVLWVSGCNHCCPECHNQITWDPFIGLDFDEKAKEEIYSQLEKDYVSGLTLSGGDPLFPANRECVTKFAKEVKEKFPNKTIWCYTGYLFEQVKDLEIMKYIDVLVDGPFILKLKDVNAPWKGSTNQKVIDVKKSLKNNRIILH